jgi:hypothetical protein
MAGRAGFRAWRELARDFQLLNPPLRKMKNS